MVIRKGHVDQLEQIRGALELHPLSIHDNQVEAAVAIILFENEKSKLEILLIQRAERAGDPWSGHISLPGGRIKPTDDSPKEAAVREVMEEVGIDIRESSQFLGTLPPSFPWNRPELKVQPFVFGVSSMPELVLGPEVVSAFWVSLSDLPNLLTQAEVQTRGGSRRVESFLVDGHIVWGFTFRVLNDLLKLQGSSNFGSQ